MPLSGFTASPNTGDSLAAQAPDSVRQLWQRGVEIFEQTTDFFRPFEGAGKSFPIQSRVDTSKGRGQKVTFTSMAGLYQRAHLGDQLFENGSHFEPVKMGSDGVTVDWFRHAVRFTERGEEIMGMRGELEQGVPEELGKWLGRLKTKHMFMTFREKGDPGFNRRYINGRSGLADIRLDDTLYYDGLVMNAATLQTANGMPAYVGKDGAGNPIHKYCIVSSSDALLSLDLDPDYKAAKIDGGDRGAQNLIFKGGFHNLRGHVIKEYTAIDHDGVGPIGSPINPKAELGVAVTAGTAAFDIKGGGYADAAAAERVDFFEDFPNHAFAFSPDDALSAGSTAFHVIIYNRSGDDIGKWGFYECTTNDGVKLTVTKRLGATGGGTRHPQVGQVVWDASKNTDAHPEGSLVILASGYGAPIGWTLFLGASSARRAYGKYQRRRVTQDHEGGFVRDVYIQSVFGQEARKDVRGRAPGYAIVAHAIAYPGIVVDPTYPA